MSPIIISTCPRLRYSVLPDTVLLGVGVRTIISLSPLMGVGSLSGRCVATGRTLCLYDYAWIRRLRLALKWSLFLSARGLTSSQLIRSTLKP